MMIERFSTRPYLLRTLSASLVRVDATLCLSGLDSSSLASSDADRHSVPRTLITSSCLTADPSRSQA